MIPLVDDLVMRLREAAKGALRRSDALMFDRAADRIEALSDKREEIAREAALHGLGRIDGLGNREPPNEKWTQGEWERRILECVPGAVELQCYALADAILALIPPTTESPNE